MRIENQTETINTDIAELSINGTDRMATRVTPPLSSGVWADDNATGRSFANEFVERLSVDHNPTELGHLVQSMTNGVKWNGVHVGFFHRLSELLMH